MVLRGRLTIVVLAGVFGLAGCGRDGTATRRPDHPVAMTHIHGLGVNPADGAVFAATHHGVFRLDADGRPVQVGAGRQDTMGFTVAGPDRFLASGHPDQHAGSGPPLLGLIESTDAGKTWRSLSLEGEADFHTLLTAHGHIYGWNSATGQVMASSDNGRTWERRATVGLLSFAVDPADPNHLLASGQKGLLASRDGGRTWQPAPGGGPAPGLLAWDREGGLWAAQLDGAVLPSSDNGRTWQRRASLPSEAAALLATKDRLYAATRQGHVIRSDDQGRTWTVLYAPT